MSTYVRAVAIALGFFLAGLSAAYQLNPSGSRVAWAMGGLASLAPYLIGLATKAPWEDR